MEASNPLQDRVLNDSTDLSHLSIENKDYSLQKLQKITELQRLQRLQNIVLYSFLKRENSGEFDILSQISFLFRKSALFEIMEKI